MKKIITIITVMFAVILMSMTAFAFQGEPSGFRGIEWGARIRDLPGMEYWGKLDDLKYYSRKGSKETLGGAKLDHIYYVFWDDRLIYVTIATRGNVNWEALKEAAFLEFGEQGLDSPSDGEYSWIGETSMVSLSYDKSDESGRLMIISTTIMDEKNLSPKSQAEAGANEDF